MQKCTYNLSGRAQAAQPMSNPSVDNPNSSSLVSSVFITVSSFTPTGACSMFRLTIKHIINHIISIIFYNIINFTIYYVFVVLEMHPY